MKIKSRAEIFYKPLMYINKLFTKPIKKYEVYSLMAHINYVNERLAEMQDNGWEIAGEIITKNKSGHCNDTYLHIPMKRRI